MESRSAVRTPVVAWTMAKRAGREMGRSNKGRRSSRLRARRPRAAKKVPLTTNAHVPSGRMRARSQIFPRTWRLKKTIKIGDRESMRERMRKRRKKQKKENAQPAGRKKKKGGVGNAFVEEECGGGGG